MRSILVAAAAVASLMFGNGPVHAQPVGARPFDQGWRFARGDVPGAEAQVFDDSSWAVVDTPHDWAIGGPFDRDAPTTGSGAWLPSGVAWYRKAFTLPPTDIGRRVFLEFDGVMERSGVWINGHHLGHRPSGYASFRYELTPHLRPAGQPNSVAVRADTAAQPASRWYAGGGIYRHVRLIVTGDVYAEAWSSTVRTTGLTPDAAELAVASRIVNRSAEAISVTLEAILHDPQGRAVATLRGVRTALAPGRSVDLQAKGRLLAPRRWDIVDPALYTAQLQVRGADGAILHAERVPFGIREARFEAASGFWLNGRNLKLKGVALHADAGPFGMAVPLSVAERRLRQLKALGVNAVRTAHHPFSPEFLDLCDRLGLLVMNEAFDMWTVAKNPQDYHLFFTDWSSIDARDFVRRDRNHPSVVIWSLGNEIHDTPYPVLAQSILERLRTIFHDEDPTRPVTMALFRPNTSGDYRNGLADMLDVVGQNYRETELAAAHAEKPTRKILGTENSKNRASWIVVRDNPAYAGMFLWTGADYLGEADRAGWPAISNPAGLLDRDDAVKPIGWERASWWSEQPVVKLARRVTEVIDTSELPTMVGIAMPQPKGPGARTDWSPPDRTPHDEKVEVYANVDEVELLLNGRSLGRKPRDRADRAIVWQVRFVPGELRAIGYRGGVRVAEDVLRTAGTAAALRLLPESHRVGAGFDDVAAVRVQVVDAAGVVVPDASMPVTVRVSGAGRLVAYDNASVTDHTPFASPTRNVLDGTATAFVRGSGGAGTIRITASAGALTPARIDLTAVP